MENSKHTPGEWKVFDTRTIHNKRLLRVTAKGKDGYVAALPDSNEANAKLIAAAPDLLDIASELFETLRRDSHCVSKYASELMDLDKAIRKATE